MAIRAALRTRRMAGYTHEEPICVYECAHRLGVEVRFVAGPSLEGMYASSGSGTIILSSLRPAARQRFTCAHELGHHFLGHGSKWDEFLGDSALEGPESPEEWAADRFASHLLMPKQAVFQCFRVRGWNPPASNPNQIYQIAGELGVGYTTLINQIQFSLDLLEQGDADRLRRVPLGLIRESAAGCVCLCDLVLVDENWRSRPIDIQVGDLVLMPSSAGVRGLAVREENRSTRGVLVNGCRAGIAQAFLPEQNWACFIRVSRKEYIGRAAFRHLEDPDDQ
jgi:hypothetical protein